MKKKAFQTKLTLGYHSVSHIKLLQIVDDNSRTTIKPGERNRMISK